MLAVAVVAGCGGGDGDNGTASPTATTAAALPGTGKPPITIGTKDFTEEFVLGELYRQALEAKGYTVDLKRNIGPTEIIDRALTSKQIDAYPEYTGITVAVVAKNDMILPSAEVTARRAKAFYAGRGQTVIGPTPFRNVDAVATTKAFARKHELKTLADLKRLPRFSLGARPEFRSRTTGLVGMRREYGLTNATFEQVAVGLQYRALDRGEVDAANVFTTDAQLASGKYTVLTDPKGVFGFQQVDFVIDKAKYDQLGGPQFARVIAAVNTRLTNAAMRSMNAAVDLDRKDPAAVAAQFLRANGLAGVGGR
jgi:osmoprotectant transport system substrate-binding protein